ncbi:PH domain-containing protein [Luethyella okanaganae]|uniref:PH domain-containing protein n=1 Tax=Luethyella okanaganae TaxID=69372 RepID=A0ABW1VFI1_9MICO
MTEDGLMDAQRDRSTMASGEALPRAALRYENLRTLSAAVTFAVLLIAAALFVKIDWVEFVALWILLPLCVLGTLIDIAVVNRLQYRAYRYTVDRSTVEIWHGLLMRSRTTISTVQILSVDIVRGPLLRSCGLASIVFRTVGGTIKLGPVTPTAAEGVRTRVMRTLEVAP